MDPIGSLHRINNRESKLKRVECINLPNLVNFTAYGDYLVNGYLSFKEVDKLENVELLYYKPANEEIDEKNDGERKRDNNASRSDRYSLNDNEENNFSSMFMNEYCFRCSLNLTLFMFSLS